jgi:hypothetical protein
MGLSARPLRQCLHRSAREITGTKGNAGCEKDKQSQGEPLSFREQK